MDNPLMERNPSIVTVLSSIFGVLAIISVILRVWSRHIKRTALVINDLAIIAALILTTALFAITVVAMSWLEVNRAYEDIPQESFNKVYRMTMIAAPFWGGANTMVKVSVLHLYLTIFPNLVFRRICYMLIAISIMWFISIILETIFICHPFAYNWDKSIQGTCGETALALLFFGISNVVIDAAIIVLPLPSIGRLQLPVWKRIGILAMFSFGALTCLISCLRISSLFNTINVLQNSNLSVSSFGTTLASISAWTTFEPMFGIINSCFPVMLPVFRKYFSSFEWTKKLTSKRARGGRSRPSLLRRAYPSFISGDTRNRQLHEDDNFSLDNLQTGSSIAPSSISNVIAMSGEHKLRSDHEF